LPNRSLLRDRLQLAMAQTSRRGGVLAVVCLDLDDFKFINETYGHAAGDEILTTIAHRIKLSIHDHDILSRLGGDEFIAVLFDLDNPDQSLPVVQHLLEVASQAVRIGSESVSLSASAGIAFYPQSEDVDPDQLLRQAGQAGRQAQHSLQTLRTARAAATWPCPRASQCRLAQSGQRSTLREFPARRKHRDSYCPD